VTRKIAGSIIEPGDVVMLKTLVGPKMVVRKIYQDDSVDCVWFGEGDLYHRTGSFYRNELQHVQP
jgi:uncharacterized protein YodC (DUF2158 family)